MTSEPLNIPKAIIIGMPASGKTRISKVLGERMNLEVKDLDSEIENQLSRTVVELFEQLGEKQFRKIERKNLKKLLNSFNGIVSTGGGAAISEKSQKLIKEYKRLGGVVIYLRISSEIAATRIKRKNTRPMFLGVDAKEKWEEIYNQRFNIYESIASFIFNSGEFEDYDLVKQIEKVFEIKRVVLNEYSVNIGRDLEKQAVENISSNVNKVMVIKTKSVDQHLSILVNSLSSKFEVFVKEVPDSEEAKTAEIFLEVLNELADNKFLRTDLIIGFGGGAVTDLSGFVAASYLRGISFINFPTTILAGVDAAVGGKTGINLSAGKNLVGAFNNPKAVYFDLKYLETLQARERIEGFGEIIKMGLVFNKRILDADFEEQVYLSILEKAKVVDLDFKESGIREFLNFGHTFGHTIEKLENFKIRHGEAVAIGMRFANILGELSEITPKQVVELTDAQLEKNKLEKYWKTDCQFEDVLEVMQVDKKTRSNKLRFIVLKNLNKPVVLTPSKELLKLAFERTVQN